MTTPSAVGPAPVSEPTHGCVRCGAQIPLDRSLCERCNPLGLEQPATSQAHGTVFVALIVAVVVLAVAGRAALSGVGPFRAEVVAVEPAAAGLAVTLAVANEGSKLGATTCQLTLAAKHGVGPSSVVLSPRIAPGERRQFTTTTERFGDQPVELAVACQAP
jgi:predicted nucleic acid-binding Zn ribbon protein